MIDIRAVISIIIYILFTPMISSLISGIDRKVTARMQGRKGPKIMQPWYDLLKLFSKEAAVVNRIQKILIIAHFVFALGSGVILFGGGDLLLMLFSLTMAEVFLILASYSVNAAYSEIGAQRELLQMMSYEPMMLLCAVGFYLTTGSFYVSDIIRTSFAPIVTMPGFFIGFWFILIIKFRKSPFDLSTSHHAHQELIKGLTGDLSGRLYGFYELAELYEKVMMLAIVGLFFLYDNPVSIIYAVIAVGAVMFSMSLIDNIFPRVKWELLLQYSYIVTLFAGGANLLILSLFL